MRSVRRALVAGCAVGCALLLAACSATVDGHGTPAPSTPSSSTSHDFPSGSRSSSPSSAQAPTSAGPSRSGRFTRDTYATAFGDPPHADLCSALTLSAYAQPGYTPSFTANVFPPGCSVRLTKSNGTHFAVNVYASTFPPQEAAGRTRKIVDDLVVYVYPFKSDLGTCERDVVASRITLVVTSIATKGSFGSRVICAGTDVMTTQLAAAARRESIRRLSLANPSVVDLDACEIVQAAGWLKLPVFEGTKTRSDAFDAGCTLDAGSVGYTSIDPMISKSSVPEYSKPTTVDGHTIYAATFDDAKDCSLTSVQGATPDGRTEMLFLDGYTTKTIPNYCGLLLTAFARYLTVAGLR